MNKTISIHLCGILFNLEEGGYDKLRNYLQTIESYLGNNSEKSEIMRDIEARIAEIFNEKLKGYKQVITEAEVEEAMAMMGRPEEFADVSASASSTENQKEYTAESETVEKRLFRDMDHATIGGVCSGLGHFFGIDMIWFRLAFAIALLFFGSGVLLYIILWAVIPEAKTTADKLKMQGKPVNLGNIESIKQGVKQFGKQVENLAHDVENEFKSGKAGARFGKAANQAATQAGRVFEVIFQFLGRVLGSTFLLVSVVLLVLLFVLFFNSNDLGPVQGNDFFGHRKVLGMLFAEPFELNLFYIALFLLLITPVFWLILGGLRLLTIPRNFLKIPLWINGFAFTIGLVLLGISLYYLFQGFREKSYKTERIEFTDTTSDTLNLVFSGIQNTKSVQEVRAANYHFFVHEESVQLNGVVRLTIEPAEGDKFGAVIKKSAQGVDEIEATSNIKDIQVSLNQTGSTFMVDRFFSLKSGSKWRNQQVLATLYVPVGKSVLLDANGDWNYHHIANQDDMEDHKMAGHLWKMESKGLKCVDCTDEKEKSAF